MNPIESIVGLYKNKRGMRFDKEAADELGMKQQTFSNYLKGRAKMPDIAIAKIADGAQLDALQVVAAANLTYQKTPDEEKEFWSQRYKTLVM